MGIFNKKKSGDGLRILSEDEIRKKLYGTLFASDESGLPGQHIPKSPSTPQPNTIHLSQQSTAVKNNPSTDLFSNVRSQQFSENPTAVKVDVNSPRVKTETKQKVDQWVKQENEFVSNAAPESKNRAQSASQNVQNALSDFAKSSWKLMAFLFAILFRVITAVDFKKKKVQQLLYAFLGLGIVIYIFSSIQSLNIKREQAMQASRNEKTLASEAASPVSNETTNQTLSSNAFDQAARVESGAVKKTVEVKNVNVVSSANVSEGTINTMDASSNATPTEQAADSAVQNKNFPYSIQIATYVGKNDSDRMLQRLIGLNVPAFIQPLERPGGKIYYCIFVGRYKNFAEAEKALNDFRKTSVGSSFQDSFVRSLKRTN